MKTAKMRDVFNGTYWTAFWDEKDESGKPVSYISAVGDTEKEAIANLVKKEKAKAERLARK